MDSPIAQIKKLVSQNQTADAISLLLESTQTNKTIHDSVLLISSKFTDLTVQKLRGTISTDDAVRLQNQVNEKILEALTIFDSKGNILPGTIAKGKNNAVALLTKITLALFFSGAVIVLIGEQFRHEGLISSIGYGIMGLGSFAFLGTLLALVLRAARP